MPYILRRFDYATTYNTCMYLWPVTFASLPLFNALALAHLPVHAETSPGRNGVETVMMTMTTPANVSIWIGLALVLALSKVAAIPYSITMLLIKRHLPAPAPAPASIGISGPGCGDRTDGSGLGSMYTPGMPGTGPAPWKGTGSGSGRGMGSGRGSALGQSNGLVQLAMCLGRAVGPVVVSTLFTALNGSTWARRWGIGWVWSIVMVCFAVVGARVTRGLR